MSYGPVSVFTTSMASAATYTSAVDLQKAWNKLTLMIPTMASGSDVYVSASESLSGTYRRVFHSPNTNSATVAAVFVTSGVTNCFVPLPNINMQFLKVELSSATTDTPYTFKIICSD